MVLSTRVVSKNGRVSPAGNPLLAWLGAPDILNLSNLDDVRLRMVETWYWGKGIVPDVDCQIPLSLVAISQA